MNLVFLLLFLIDSIFNIAFAKKNSRKGMLYTKPLLMPLLILFYVSSSYQPNYLIIAALIAGFLGDVFLLSKKKSFILAGILAFLIGHGFYIIAFLGSSVVMKGNPLWVYFCLLPYAATGMLLYELLFPSIKFMRRPVIFYMFFIFMMSFISLTRLTAVPFLSFILVFLGSIFFIISDCILAFNMFSDCKKNTTHYIMSTYIMSQFLIVIGFLI